MAKIDFSKLNNSLTDDDVYWDGKEEEENTVVSPEKQRNLEKHEIEYKINSNDIFKGTVAPKFTNINIPLDKLVPASEEFNPYPSADDKTIEKIKASIYKSGQLTVALVREQEDGNFTIIGGHNLYKALCSLNDEHPGKKRFSFMRCNVYTVDDINDEAFKLAVVEYNEVQQAKVDKRMLAVGYKVRRENIEKSSFKNFGTSYGSRIREKLMEKYKLSGGTAARIEKISNLIRPYMDLYVKHELSDSDALVIAGLKGYLQEFLLSQNIIKFDTYKRSLVAKCDTIEDLKAALNATPENMYNGIITDIPMPKTSKNYSIPIPIKDKKKFFEGLSDYVRKLDLKDEAGKQFLIQVLDGYSQMK